MSDQAARDRAYLRLGEAFGWYPHESLAEAARRYRGDDIVLARARRLILTRDQNTEGQWAAILEAASLLPLGKVKP